MELMWSEGGVIITKKDGLYGAVDETGEEIVANKYTSWWVEPNTEGQFALGSEDEAICFDKKGNELLTICRPSSVYINENCITYSYMEYSEEENADGVYAAIYDLEKAVLQTYTQTTTRISAYRVTPVMEDEFYITWKGVDYADIYRVDRTTLKQERISSHWNRRLFAVNGEYGVASENGWYFGVGLLSKDGSEELMVDINELLKVCDLDVENYSYWPEYFIKEGQHLYNIGKQMVLGLESKTDNKEYYFLLDFTKAEVEERELGTAEYSWIEKIVSNPEDVVVTVKNKIYLSESGNYFASQDDDRFYIDAKGNIIADFADCSEFVGDYALAIEEDGMAYVVDKKFQKVSEGYPADRVYASGNVLCIEKGEQTRYLYVTE
ncbi:MAG: hypothetical protein IKT67_06180 [Lachnospiraceae bacterium]|nr:hypothetical protein [Lachnospiraceae bacterium]